MERYVWDLVAAATALPRPAIPLAAGLLLADTDSSMPTEARYNLLALLSALGDVSPSPAQEALIETLRLARQPGAPWDAARQSPHWKVIQTLKLEGHAMQALRFLHATKSAMVRHAERDVTRISER